MAYSELIKSFEKIRDYMRDFYVFGFKSRDDYTKKSARSYDDERRRMESWLGDHMAFRRTPEGKTVFISVDNRSVPFNPLYNAWKAKSFTDKDLVLHFYLLDLLEDGMAMSVGELADGVAARMEGFDEPLEIDESTVRKKLREYEELGLLRSEKQGRVLRYSLAVGSVDAAGWAEAAAFFSEEAPLGVIGSYLLDRQEERPQHFSYKHHYLLHTLDSQVLYDVLLAMDEKRCVDLVNFSVRHGAEKQHRVFPLRFYVSTQTGREYLLSYHYDFRKPMFFRLDSIRAVTPGPVEKKHETYAEYARRFDENLWGVSTGEDYCLDHVEMTISVCPGEDYILDRLLREKRHGSVEALDEYNYRFTAEVYDAGELLTWARTFLGRVVSFESDNDFAEQRFYEDIEKMRAMYGEVEA
ncbi:MAG: WYL domain-containing protein [Firmicutes bacterium]|nr:WYL domain-containing protein [Bacillota bacterium]